jgi:thiamine monophosphate synthase
VKRALPRLHAITDERIARRVDLDDILHALAGIDMAAHARGHALSGREHYDLSVRLAGRPPVRLFVNYRLDIALST